ncbi:CPBP family intramembrane glutamic endopeptidase [Flavobacterium maritimum]|uniref:CPBP family intramembrane glutamic endopeptidase n=1 Tax=Flavobacterium maritimum TaxID=3149042 RepID=UPI0032B56B73
MNSLQLKLMQKRAQRAVLDALLCSLGLAIFAYLVTNPFPYKITALFPLLITAFIISRQIKSPLRTFKLLFENVSSLKIAIYTIIGIQMGLAAAMYHRGNLGMTVLPEAFRSFALIAASIGILEELVFRGFIQGRLMLLNTNFAVLFAAFAHAFYKVCLFLSPAAPYQQDLTAFFFWSFAAYVALGLLRFYSKSMIPVIISHAVFDLIVYAEILEAPWWVW